MGDHHNRLSGAVAGYKGVDAGFLVHHVEFRHRHAAGDGHFLNNIA